jgi:hypothetical protein
MPVETMPLIRDLRRQAEEYAEMGRAFPLFGAGPLFEALDAISAALAPTGCADKPPE